MLGKSSPQPRPTHPAYPTLNPPHRPAPPPHPPRRLPIRSAPSATPYAPGAASHPQRLRDVGHPLPRQAPHRPPTASARRRPPHPPGAASAPTAPGGAAGHACRAGAASAPTAPAPASVGFRLGHVGVVAPPRVPVPALSLFGPRALLPQLRGRPDHSPARRVRHSPPQMHRRMSGLCAELGEREGWEVRARAMSAAQIALLRVLPVCRSATLHGFGALISGKTGAFLHYRRDK